MIDHILNLRLVQTVVSEIHDTVAHQYAFYRNVSQLAVHIVVQNEVRQVRNVLSSITLP